MIKEIIDNLLYLNRKRGLDSNSIILDRGTKLDFELELINYYESSLRGQELLNLDFYQGYRIVEHKGSRKIHIEIK